MTNLKGIFIILVRIAVWLQILNSNYLKILNLEEIIVRERQICYVTRTFTKLVTIRIISFTNFNTQFLYSITNVCYTTILDMFRSLTCPSSGGQIVFTQLLVSSLSVNVCTVHRCTVQPLTESDDTRCCENTICPLEDGHVNARNISRIVV